jgi:hypothetical protein
MNIAETKSPIKQQQQPWRPDPSFNAVTTTGKLSEAEQRMQRILAAEQKRRNERIAFQQRAQGHKQRREHRQQAIENKLGNTLGTEQNATTQRKGQILAAEQRRREQRLRNQPDFDYSTIVEGDQRVSRPQNRKPRPQSNTIRTSQGKGKLQSAKNSEKIRQSVQPKGLVEEEDDGADITLDEIEHGGDMKQPAQFRDAEFSASNLEALFCVTSHHALSAQGIKERLGGNFARYSPHSIPENRLALKPVEQANLVLAKRRDVSLSCRQNAASVIANSTSV